MNQEKLYLVVLQYSRTTPQTTEVGYHKEFVFALTEREAEAQATFKGATIFLTKDGWYFRVAKTEEVERNILERAAKEILGWSPP